MLIIVGGKYLLYMSRRGGDHQRQDKLTWAELNSDIISN